MSALPTTTADRLAKIIPRLASTHDGEVIAVVGAIRRTLDSAGFDLHDLAEHVAAMVAFAAAPVRAEPRAPYTSEHQRTPAEWAEANRKMREAEEARAKRSPWPTFRQLNHFARVEMLDRVAKSSLSFLMTKPNRDAFDALRVKIVQRPQEIVTRKEVNLFNRLMSALWAMDQNRTGKVESDGS